MTTYLVVGLLLLVLALVIAFALLLRRSQALAGAASEVLRPKEKEDVQFSVYRPDAVVPDRWYTMIAFAHLGAQPVDSAGGEPDPVAEVARQAEQVLGEQTPSHMRLTQDSAVPIARESELTFLPEVEGVVFNPPSRSFIWTESVHREEFRFRADRSLVGRTARGRLLVLHGALRVAEVALAIPVEEKERVRSEQAVSRAARFRKIFASYSRRDAWVVDQCEQYARAFGDRYLRDVVDLRAGEEWSPRLEEMIWEADMFQLFWSWNSMDSPFVRREWEYALALKRPKFVIPTYWEHPMPARPEAGLPPPELQPIQFGGLILPRRDDEQLAAGRQADRQTRATGQADEQMAASSPADDQMAMAAPSETPALWDDHDLKWYVVRARDEDEIQRVVLAYVREALERKRPLTRDDESFLAANYPSVLSAFRSMPVRAKRSQLKIWGILAVAFAVLLLVIWHLSSSPRSGDPRFETKAAPPP